MQVAHLPDASNVMDTDWYYCLDGCQRIIWHAFNKTYNIIGQRVVASELNYEMSFDLQDSYATKHNNMTIDNITVAFGA